MVKTTLTEKKLAALATEQDPRWQAVVNRDRASDGQFVYSVTTTGVYCRPSCGARLARPGNVRFHATPEAAEAAGFRACKRCKPNAEPLSEQQAARIGAACRVIEAADSIPSLAELSRAAGLSRYHFHRLFKSVTGLTPKAYAQARRAGRVRSELATDSSVTAAIYDSGFNSSGRFYETSNQVLGMTPTQFRSGGERTQIRFAVGECSLGSILVAQTEKGICAIFIGDDPEALVQELQDRFPKAELIGGDAEFENVVARVVGFIESPGIGLDLPLDVRGTAFQQRVWQALRAIPLGTTLTYSELAAKLGMPKASRAVGAACGANPIAVAIPCHRVVAKDGALTGYHWGVERKRALLGREKIPST